MFNLSIRQKDFMFFVLSGSFVVIACLLFFWLVSGILINGLAQLNIDFLAQEPMNSGREGGIASILASTLYILLICLSLSVPLGLGTATFIYEFSNTSSPWVSAIKKSLDLLASLPSIVFGLFGSVFFCEVLGLGFSILAGGLTLSCMVLPLFIRVVADGLGVIPADIRRGGLALGMRRSRLLYQILLPYAMPSIVSGFVLGTGRALAETAALIFTSGYVDRYPTSLFDSGRSLSIHIYDLSMNVAGGDTNAYRSASILLVLVLAINLGATLLLGRSQIGGDRLLWK